MIPERQRTNSLIGRKEAPIKQPVTQDKLPLPTNENVHLPDALIPDNFRNHGNFYRKPSVISLNGSPVRQKRQVAWIFMQAFGN